MPGGLEGARANRAFLGRAVRWLSRQVGVGQFLDIGTGIPQADNVRGVAQSLNPAARVVYVDNDPIVLAHAHGLLRSMTSGGPVAPFYGAIACKPLPDGGR